jgi:hypothetical protein
MTRAATGSTRNPPESFTATLRLRGHEFAFRLFTRPLRLGDSGTVQYYWMDSSQFRNMRTEAAAANFRSVVGFWAAAMREVRLQHDLDQQIHYVLAVCYALFGRCKSLQGLYHDAYLAPNSVRVDAASLPDDVRQRIQEVVHSRDRFQVQQELDTTLGRFESPAKVMPLLQEACRRWVGKGVSLLRRQGNDGLEQFLQEVDGWMAKYRKKGGHRWVRHFLNLFAYESKAAFSTCYANAWVGLIPWLCEHRALDPLSERFLRVWHNQNQPIEIPHGQTPGGILYPTRQGVLVAAADSKGRPVTHCLQMQTEQIGPTHVRDVFNGQVLSLHPLSGFFMKDPSLCAIAGRFFASTAYDLALGCGQTELGGAYWDLVGAILSAAHLYRQALDRQAQGRGTRQRAGAEEAARSTPAGLSEAMLLEEFASSRKVCCPACGGALHFRRYHPVGPDEEDFPAEYACRSCGRDVPHTIDRTDLERWLRSAD